MKILFICGTIQPGKDGVGDYTRRLAGNLVEMGYEVFIISLYDSYIDDEVSEIQQADTMFVHTHRIPFQWNDTTRFLLAGKIIDSFNPDWVSLQFVVFSFHSKGLPWGLGNKLANLLENRRVHIMFHELWVAMDQESSIKLKILGQLQKTIIKKILKGVKPKIIHTHTPLYKWQLNKLGFTASILPLFGNIPVKKFQDIKKNVSSRFVVFGSIHFGAPIDTFATELHAFGKLYNTAPEVVFIGRCGKEKEDWEKSLDRESIHHTSLGEQTLEQISEVLTYCEYGLTSTPYLLTDKSGTVAAMLEHGLPVICVARNWNVKSFLDNNKEAEGIFKYIPGRLDTILHQKWKVERSLLDITNQFVNSLIK